MAYMVFRYISATDADCGVNGMVNYTLDEERTKEFLVQPLTGKVCVNLPLDHETRSTYEFPVLATDRGGESTSAMVKIQVTDINDNSPIFYPREYNVSLRENVLETVPIVIIVATDADSGAFGTVTYRIVSGNVHQLFRIDSTTGELFMNERLNKRNAMHHLTVSAVDGGGRDSQGHAHIWVSVIDSHQRPPTFKHSRYNLSIREDAPIHSDVGIVRAITSDRDAGNLHYSIYSGDPNGYFSIEPQTGRISTNKVLDHEKHPFILLNVQAQSGRPPSYG
uniref:Cadherin domain-containing protein n=1 Tax=Strigamia maritima TaxID=126957 RepID=T1JHQ6_STRMM